MTATGTPRNPPARQLRALWHGTRGRLFLLVLLTVIPAVAVQLYGAWSNLQQNLAARQAEVALAANHAQGDFATLLTKARSVFTDLVRLNEMRTPNNCTLIFSSLRLSYARLAPEATNLGLADATGNLYCSVNPVQGERNVAAQPYFQTAFKTLDMAVGAYSRNALTGAPSFTVAYPVMSFDGEVQTVIVASFGLQWLTVWQNEVALPPGAAYTLFSPNGEFLGAMIDGQPLPPGAPLTAHPAAPLALLKTGQGVVQAPDLDGVVRLHAVVPLGPEGQTAVFLQLGYPVAPLYTKAYQSLEWELVLLALTTALAMAIAAVGSESLFLRPLRQLMNVTEQVQAGDLTARATGVRGLLELTRLAQAFDRMTGALQQREGERQRAQTELEQSEARFRAIFESSPAGIGVMGLDRKILDLNPAICRMFGYTREALLGRTSSMVTYPDDEPRSVALFQELVAGQRNYYWDERRYLRQNGEMFWAQVTMSLVRNPAGQPLYLVGMVTDINEQRRALADLQESEARFRAILDNAAVGIAVMTLDRRIVQINPTVTRLTGYTPEEMATLNPSLMAVEADRELDREMFADLVAGRRSQYLAEKRYIRKDGSMFWGRVNFALVRDGAGKPLYTIGMIEDITEEKEAAERLAAQETEYRRALEQRIAERTEELSEANERLREKAAQDAVTAERTRLARDLHDAVTQTLFSATLIADVLPELWRINPAEGVRRLDELHQLNRGALAEMRTLLVELRPNALVEVPLPTLLRQLAEALAGRARLTIQLSAEGERRLPADVQVGLYRIAQEALNNVVKHAKASQAVVTLRLGDTVRLTVADDGAGFDPTTVTADHLGLKIMRERADAIQARLMIYSEPGEGTQISVTWA